MAITYLSGGRVQGTASDKTSLGSTINLPVGTRFEETDTRKIYRMTHTAESSVTLDNVFNATGGSGSTYYWVAGGSGSSYVTQTDADDTSGKIVVNHSGGAFSGYSRGIAPTLTDSYASGGAETKTFVFKFKWYRGGSDAGNNNAFGIASYDWADNFPSNGSNDKLLSFQLSNGNLAFARLRTGVVGGSTSDVSTEQDADQMPSTGSSRYYTITGNGTTWKLESWTDTWSGSSGYHSSADMSFPTNWTTTAALDRFFTGTWAGGTVGQHTISEVYATFTHPATDQWVLKGNAS